MRRRPGGDAESRRLNLRNRQSDPPRRSGRTATATCPSCKKAIGGSLQVTGTSVTLLSSSATSSFAGWVVLVRAESTTVSWQLTVAAICVNA